MSSLVSLSTNNNSHLFDRFAEICPEKSMGHFKGMRKALEDAKEALQPKDVYSVYIHAMSIAKEVVASENIHLKDRFLVILKAFSNEASNDKIASDLGFDFSRIINMINQGKTELSCKLEIVNVQDDLKVQEAAFATASLMQKGMGSSFEVNWFSTRIKSHDGWCVLARDEQNKIIASVVGTSLTLTEKNIKVFHFNVLVRSPEYPLIHFTTLLKNVENSLTERFDSDFLSLCVAIDNPAKKIYEKMEFEEISIHYNSTLERDAVFMLKKSIDSEKEEPCYADIRAALDLVRQRDRESF
jgi:hypothetical protein